MIIDSLGNRMKEYEDCFRYYLPRKMPIIIRIDGRAFHTLTNGFKKPFDELFSSAMRNTTTNLCGAIMGVKIAYMQSDEISLLLTNNDDINTEPWFGNNLQKLVSLSASLATLYFNINMTDRYFDFLDYGNKEDIENMAKTYWSALNVATFDSRVFILPENEVVNYFIWRQQDATRNSIQMVAQSLYSHNQLLGKNSNKLQDMIIEKGQNWNDYPTQFKRGICVKKKLVETELDGKKVTRNRWVPDFDIPIFTQNREYIESTFIKN